VGFPHPSDAATASAGTPRVSSSEYRFELMGSAAPPPQQVPGEQQPPASFMLTDFAIAPYRWRTAAWISWFPVWVVMPTSNIFV
jgi:hypothetical protein